MFVPEAEANGVLEPILHLLSIHYIAKSRLEARDALAGLGVEGLTISKTVGSAIDHASNALNVTSVSDRANVAPVLAPVVASGLESPRHGSNQSGVGDERLVEVGASLTVVVVVSQLHGTTSAVSAAATIARAPSVGSISVDILGESVVLVLKSAEGTGKTQSHKI